MKFFVFFFILMNCGLIAKPMNFVFILADDLGKKDLGAEGSTFYETPNLDALAKSSARFTDGYSTCQVCSPSRASIMLGQFPATHGITEYIGAAHGLAWKRNTKVMPADYGRQLPAADTTIAEAMKAAGYKTFFAGKWHLGGQGSYPEDHGFDINIGGYEKGGPYGNGKVGGFFSPYGNPKMEEGPEGENLSVRLGMETAKFIEANKDEKFFAFLSFYAVHAPIQTSRSLFNKYQAKAEKMGLTGEKKRFIFDRTQAVRQVQDNPIYAGMMENMDDGVGVVLEKLKELGLDKNTVVIFTSDNGGVSSGDAYATACLPFRGGKGRQWEGGIRQPFYVHVPGLADEEKFIAVPATGADFYPTILDLAGLELKPEQHVDGVSLKKAMQGQAMAKRDLFWHYPHYGNQGGEPSSIIRSGNWKLIHYYEDGRNELYKIDDDIGEQNDLAANHPEKGQELAKKLESWLQEKNVKFPEKDKRYDAEKAKQQLANKQKLVGMEKKHADYLSKEFKGNGKQRSNGYIEEGR
jgi:arylsulfatase A-like enzyme